MAVRDVAQEEGTKRGSHFYHVNDGFHYHINRRDPGGSIYFKCIYVERGCQGRAVWDPIDGFMHSKAHNNHGVDVHYPDEMALRRKILERCRNLEYVAYRTIMEEESRGFDDAVKARVTYSRMRTPMRNARLERFPQPIPQTLRELTEVLMDQRYRVLTMTDDGLDNIYAGSVDDVNGGHHILFVSDRNLEHMRNFLVLHSDGTFKCVPIRPEFADQFFVIVGVWRHHIVPLGWALMESRSEAAYTAVLQLLHHLLGPNVALTRVISDFETGQQNAWQNVFQVPVQGCLWHLCRAYLEQVVSLNLLPRMRRLEEVRKIIRLSMALALLPEELIVRGFNCILQHSRNEGNYIHNIVRPYLRFVWRYWVSRPWRRSRMCVFGSSQRTNNACESQNRMMGQVLGTHPGVYQCLFGLVTLEQRTHNTFCSLEMGRRVSRARKRASIVNDQRIVQLSEDLINPPGPIDQAIFRFLQAASHILDNVVDEAMQVGRNRNGNGNN